MKPDLTIVIPPAPLEFTSVEMHLVPVQSTTKKRALKCLDATLHHFPYYTIFMFMVYIALYGTLRKQDVGDIRLMTSKGDEVYRWYTYSLAHFDGMHVGVNMMGLCIYGTMLEWDHASWRVILVHLASILGGAFGVGWESRFRGGKSMNVIGASGGVYGLLASEVSNLTLNWSEFSTLQRAVYLTILLSCIASDVGVNIAMYNKNISYSNHACGFVFGVLGGLSFLTNKKVLVWEKGLRWGGRSLMCVLGLAGAINLGLLG